MTGSKDITPPAPPSDLTATDLDQAIGAGVVVHDARASEEAAKSSVVLHDIDANMKEESVKRTDPGVVVHD